MRPEAHDTLPPGPDRREAAGRRPDRRRFPQSLLLIRVLPDRVEVNEQFSRDQTAVLVRRLRELGVAGEVVFRTPCG